MLIGVLLTPCNVYSGLKIGWSFNMSITAGLLSFAFWRFAQDLVGARPWHLQENMINQTTASSAASIVSGGLVAPIPALTLLTGTELSLPMLWLWVFSVSVLGIVVAIVLRGPMLFREQLVFPAGVATAETIREIHAEGSEAAARVRMLLSGLFVAGALKLFNEFGAGLARWSPPIAWPASGSLRASGVGAIGFKELGFSLDPSLLMVGFGAIIGLRAGLSLLLGAVVGWLVLAPWVLAQGWAAAGPAGEAWFAPLVEWLLWPGVTLMTVASLTSFAQAFWRRRRVGSRERSETREAMPVSRQVFAVSALAAGSLAVASQYLIFGIQPWLGVVSVLLAGVLAVVAARVVGETGIPPIGAIGKIAQLSFGVAAPANQTINLMGANVTGGAAGQCADLMDDLRAGHLLGTEPGRQILAQCYGVLVGSLVGCLTYRLLIPDPQAMLLTAEWPAPAVATWKAVAEVLSSGLEGIPPGALPAMAVAAGLGLGISVAQGRLAPSLARWLPSGPALGLALVIPAWISLSMTLGAVAAATAARIAPGWASRFVLALAAGFVAGESLAGIAAAMSAFAGR
jgi:uncharacterized oligopeptide transporter (OPT) family protein